jgi:hypothetical protein
MIISFHQFAISFTFHLFAKPIEFEILNLNRFIFPEVANL